MSCESHSDALSELPSSESVIWQTLLTNPNQQEVRLDEIIAVLQRLMNGLMKAKAVELMVQSFVTSNGLVSEMEIMNKREFKRLVDRLIDEWIESADKNGDGAISRKEFYDNFYSVYGWQAWLAKKHINKTFDQALKFADSDGDELMSKEEVKELLRRFAVGEAKIDDVVSIPTLAKVGLI